MPLIVGEQHYAFLNYHKECLLHWVRSVCFAMNSCTSCYKIKHVHCIEFIEENIKAFLIPLYNLILKNSQIRGGCTNVIKGVFKGEGLVRCSLPERDLGHSLACLLNVVLFPRNNTRNIDPAGFNTL